MRAVLFLLAIVVLAAVVRPSGLRVPDGFAIETIADVAGARELIDLPNGDLLVGTEGRDVYIIANAEGTPATPHVFATVDDDRAAGVAFASDLHAIFVATMHHVFLIPYRTGERHASQIRSLVDVRSGTVAPGTDGDVHTTTSVAWSKGLVYVAVGSSCNATMDDGRKPCAEVDASRAAVSTMRPDGSNFIQRAKRIRNAIALAVNPQTGSVWVGDAGQDDLPFGHPYEFLDDLTIRPGDADYGWPDCEEDHRAYVAGAACTSTIAPLVELPAYSTIIGAAFYPMGRSGPYSFPPHYRGGLFVTAHGSWHRGSDGCDAAPSRVVFVAMRGDRPVKSVDWSNPAAQWTDFVTGFQSGCVARIGRATGITVGAKGSLFIADDAAGAIYRVRPSDV